MTEAELLALRTVLADRRGELLDRLARPSTAIMRGTETPPDRRAGFLRLLADLQTAIAAVDAERLPTRN